MKEMVFEWLICILCASVLMIIHEMVKTAIYLLQKRRMHQKAAFSHSMWAVYRYIDPIGLILAVVSNVPFRNRLCSGYGIRKQIWLWEFPDFVY